MIAHVISNFEELGGSEASLIKVLNSYKNEEVIVVSLKSVSQKIKCLIKNNKIQYISLRICSIKSFVLGLIAFIKLIEKFSPKFVFAWMYHANFFCSLSKLLSGNSFLLVWGVRHSLDDFKGEKYSIKLLISTGRFLQFTAHKVFYCSLASLRQHSAFRYSDIQKSIYVPNGYPVRVFDFKDITKRDLVIGFAGRFHDAKDLPLFFCMCRILSKKGFSIKMKLCGRGICIDNAELLDIISQSGVDHDRVDLLGEQSDMTKFYSSLDIFVLTSKTEGFPNVLAEAILCSVPVFSTDVGDSATIINNDSYISPVKNAVQLASNIEKFMEKSKEQRYAECKKIHENVSNRFSLQRFYDSYKGRW